jgi:hypothetical protein
MRSAVLGLLLAAFGVAACGDDGASLADYFPDDPKPTGEAQSVWAGQITAESASELIPGPASAGMPGDYFMRNSKARFVIQAPARVIGAVPQGGNLVDAVPLDASGDDAAADQFGELGLIFMAGGTCRHDTLEVIQDGSGGGAAVIRAVGETEPNDFINLRGLALLSIPPEIDPDIEDSVECATTYILEPDSASLQVYFSLFNAGDIKVRGPVGTLNDSGGEIGAWFQGGGFERLGVESITSATDPAPTDYLVYQGPDVAYGLLPRHDDPERANSTFLIAGVSVMLFAAEQLLDFLNEDYWIVDMPPKKGDVYRIDVAVGFDGADMEEAFVAGAADGELGEVTGTATWMGSSDPAAGARVALFDDPDNSGDISEGDGVVTYFDAGPDGSFSGKVRPGTYLVKAEVYDQAVSASSTVTVTAGGSANADVALPKPIRIDFEITDADTSNLIPAKVAVFGHHPAAPDSRMWDLFDRTTGVLTMRHAIAGSTSAGAAPDAPLYLPPGTYRFVASRGTEWSIDSQLVTLTAGTDANLSFELAHVVDTANYLSSEYHVHQLGSPDSPIINELRVRSAAAAGVELFAATDHDFVSDLQPVIEQLGIEGYVRNIPGLEVTPFVYGHFNAYPIDHDTDSPNGGAIDWARGMEGYAMIPGEIFDAMRSRGAELVQINHPRTVAGFDFQSFFDRAGLNIDFDNRLAENDLLRQPVPNDWMRLPETSLWSNDFNALEVWNGFAMTDSNDDGIREIARLDMVMRDWFGFLSLGMDIVPLGNSDTHATIKDPMGMPRTLVRVTDDSSNALETGNIVDDILITLVGKNGAARDVVVTNGPFISVQATGAGAANATPLGAVIDASGGTVTFDIEVTSPAWAPIDTLELFANETLEVGGAADPSALTPRFCFTSRTDLAENDTCAQAIGGAQALTVELEDLGNGHSRYRATATVTVMASDIVNRTGATGDDAWFVIRTYGTRSIFPMLTDGVLTDANIDTLVSGSQGEIDAILDGAGVPAAAFTAPIYVDFDGGGYTAVFAP